MTKAMYVGVGDVARRVKKFYVGVNNVARRVVKAYVGVNNVARQFYTSDFWMPGGISATNIIAAYQFKGAESENAALTNLVNPSTYKLTKQVESGTKPTWTSADGFNMSGGTHPYLSNSDLNALTNIKTIIVRYSGLPSTSSVLLPVSQIKGQTTSGTKNPLLYARFKMSVTYNGATSTLSSNYPAVITSWASNKLTYYVGDSKLASTGVLAYSNKVLYKNGTAMTTTEKTVNCSAVSTVETNLSTTFNYSVDHMGGAKIIAIAFYNKALSASQIKEVSDGMLAI